MNATAPSPLTDAPERIAQLIWVLCQTVTERCGIQVRTLTVAQVEYICGRLLAARKRFRNVVERIRAGKPPKVRARKPLVRKIRPKRLTLAELARDLGAMPRGWQRSARDDRARARAAQQAAREAAAAGKTVPLWRALRQNVFGWLCPLVGQIPGCRHSAPAHANQLRQMLAEPEMQALLLSHPYVGEALRSVCNALGVDKSLLHRPPRAVVDAAPATDGRESATSPAAEESVPGTPPAPSAMAAARKNGFGAAGGRPPPTAERAMPPARGARGPGVVIIDYWDVARG